MGNKIAEIGFLFFLILSYGCLQVGSKNIINEKTDLCLVGEVDNSFSALAKNAPNATVKWLNVDLFSPSEIETCRLIVIKDDGNGRYVGRLLRQKIRDAVYGGSTLVLYKRAATLVRNDSSILGWNLIIGDVIPCVMAPTAKQESFGDKIINGTLIITESDDATAGVQNIDVKDWTVTNVAVKQGKQVAIIREGEMQSSMSSVAIVKSNYGLGQTYYLAYNPLLTPGIVANIFYSVFSK